MPCQERVMAGRDPFAVLPGPVLGIVLVHLEDLASLHNPCRQSPTVFSLLHEYGTATRIIEEIMNLCVPQQTQVLIRKFAFLRWNIRPVSDLDAFIEQYIKSDNDYNRLPCELSTTVVCDILAAAATIRYLAHAGMHEMVNRCMSLELLRMQNPKRYIRNAYRTPKMWTSEYFPVPKPPRERYQQIDAGPPSAIEEQRAIRALWQLFLIWELPSIVSGPSPCWDWTPSEANQLQVLHFDDIWKHSLRNDIREQIRTMADCSCLFPALSSPIERYRAAKSLAHSAQWCCQYDCPPPATPHLDDMEFAFGAPEYRFVLGDLSGWYTSPARYVEFRAYRRFGFAIWDHERMVGLGLLPQKSDGPRVPQGPRGEPDLYVRWESILSEEDLEEIDRKRKYFWPGREIVRLEFPW